MRPVEIKDMFVGLLTVVLMTMTIGQYNQLRSFTGQEAARTLKGWP